jgi:formate dehydrogenase major subunit
MWAEEDGHYLNLEGRIQEAHHSVTAPENVVPSIEVLKSLAAKIGLQPDENWQAALCSRPAPVAIAA